MYNDPLYHTVKHLSMGLNSDTFSCLGTYFIDMIFFSSLKIEQCELLCA